MREENRQFRKGVKAFHEEVRERFEQVDRIEAAEVMVESRGNLSASRARVLREKQMRRDQNAGEAIAALARLFVDKGLPQFSEPWTAYGEGLDGLDRFTA